MNQIKNSILALTTILLAATSFTNCKPEKIIEEPPVPVAPKVSVEMQEEMLEIDAAEFSVKIEGEATAFYYGNAVKGTDTLSVNWTKVETVGDEELTYTVENLEEETEYTFYAYAENTTAISKINQVDYTTKGLLPTIEAYIVDGSQTYTSVSFGVKVFRMDAVKYFYYPKDARPDNSSIVWNTHKFNTEEAESIIDIENLETVLGQSSEFVIELVGLYDDEMEESETLTLNFSTLKAEIINVTKIVENPFSIQVDVTFLNEYAEAFYINIERTEWFNMDSFFDNIEGGYSSFDPIQVDTTYTKLALTPATDYTLIYIAANIKEDEPREDGSLPFEAFVGDTVILNIRTADFSTGGVNESITIKVVDTENDIKFSEISPTVIREEFQAETITSFFYGAVKTSDLSSTTLDDYIATWFSAENRYATKFEYTPTGQWTKVPTDSVKVRIQTLAKNTDYTLFTIPIDSEGRVGNASSSVYRTTDTELDPSLTFDYEDAKIGYTTVEFVNLTMAEGVNRILYYKSTEELSDEDAIDELVPYTTSGGNAISAYSKTISGLEPGVKYYMYFMPVNTEKGIPGALIKKTFTTNELVYNESLTVNASVSEVVQSYGIQVKCNVTFNEGVTGYYAGAIDLKYSFWDKGIANPTDEEIMYELIVNHAFISQWGLKTKEGASSHYVEVETAVIMFLPVDANGNLGLPVRLYFELPEEVE